MKLEQDSTHRKEGQGGVLPLPNVAKNTHTHTHTNTHTHTRTR